MSIPWIKVEATLPHKPEVMQMAAQLNTSEHAVVGHLVQFWIWCDGNLTGQCPIFSGTVSGVDRVAGCSGFTQAMLDCGWLKMNGKQFEVCNFEKHLAQSAKTRASEAERKRKQRGERDNVPEKPGHTRDNVPKKPGPEEIRGEKIDSSGGARAKDTDQVFIPTAVDIPKCHEAFNSWCDYLEKSGLDVQSPRLNTIQAQMIWRNAHRLGADKWIKCVELSIRNGYKQIVQNPDRPKGESKKDFDPDFLKAVKVCKEYPSGSDYDREKREQELGPQLIRIVRHMTTARLAEVDRYTQKAMAAEWEIVRETQL